MRSPLSSHSSEPFSQLIFYEPSAIHIQDTNTEAGGESWKSGWPKGTKSFTPFIPAINNNAAKHPVGRPQGTGYKQLAQKEIGRQKCDNPAPYAAVGLTVPATGSSPSTWKEIMRQPFQGVASSSNTVPLNTLSSVLYQPNSTPSLLIPLPDQSSPNANQQLPGFSTTLSSHTTVLECAQKASSSATDNGNASEALEFPSVSNLAQSLLHLIDLDEDQIIENSVDSLIAEGIGENDTDEDEDVDDGYKFEKDNEQLDPPKDTTSHSSASLSTPEQRQKRTLCPYPTWFQNHLTSAMEQIKADQLGVSGQLRLYDAGTFWFPTKST
ncbi:hypothetical protein GYMLUDRAFT_240515 [Collybiopsis luxurians FD-317 M1]|nr:hypothetical protein GYMLUDRAFT_240515 [Collybiopsis luxurians FD-317 M1]